MALLSPESAYQQAVSRPGFQWDPDQEQAVVALEMCYQAIHSATKGDIRGVYLCGPVGRGKTWLMDMFQRGLKVSSRRQHFHHFMQWVHRRLFTLSGIADPLSALAQELASEVRVLCFDELFVNDIADAMLLGRLFRAMFKAGVVMVATSNLAPEDLYADGFNRGRFVPAIASLQRHMQVVHVGGTQDHRRHPGVHHPRYWVSDPTAIQGVFNRLSGSASVSEVPLTLGTRQLRVVCFSEIAVWVKFYDLCDQPFAAADFINLCDRFQAILLENLPNLSALQKPARIARGTEDGANYIPTGDRELPCLSVKDDSIRRFIALVDECYDRRVPLYIEASVPLSALYIEGYLKHPFQRTLSRLQEMQLQRFKEDDNQP